MNVIHQLAVKNISKNNKSDVNLNIQQKTEEYLRKALRQRLQKINRREPLSPSYEGYLTKNNINVPILTENIQHKIFTSRLRDKVEKFMLNHGVETDPMRKCGKFRETLDDESMRAAFTLRECKQFEQDGFTSATLSASLVRRLPGSLTDEGTRKREVEAMTLGLKERDRKKREQDRVIADKVLAAAKNKTLPIVKSSNHRENVLIMDLGKKTSLEHSFLPKENNFLPLKEKENDERERKRSVDTTKDRKRKHEKDSVHVEREKGDRKRQVKITLNPQQSLLKLYMPIFRSLWDMEFRNLHGTNPFRIVIDNENCAAMGISDYCDIVKKPMNLTYIKGKVENACYETLKDFFDDVDLLINNALLYNSDPSNEYHIAALLMKKKFGKLVKKVMQKVQQHQIKDKA